MENLQQQEMQDMPNADGNEFSAQRDQSMNNRNVCNRFANTLGGNVTEFDGDLCEVSKMRNFGVIINGRPSKAARDMMFSYESMDRQGRTLNLAEIVLRQEEVRSFMNSMNSQGLNVTALHNHHINDSPRLFYMHVNSVEEPAAFAQKMQRAMNNF
ncbi:MAG TPA: DUF1259 domain-containing protein [Oscillospiraceae bacterium]|nr:DUF1259 domain-containing protein [Oscillospiraceae bacterium]HPS35208.1 DUF1259 domain-containing protein [Oscillospiraceae bacterium]